ncbi:hypothetical protein Lal_00027172 [Lupinus albus]|nr:hypothetical protein Lal_00027172 [Lupinus albus]
MLQGNGWLIQMYDLRNMWIPAYFKDIFLAGILRTTSRSESENSFFGNYLNKNVSLVELWMRFEFALESQRHNELLADNDNLHSMTELKLHKDIEKHGREVYTHEKFYIFQRTKEKNIKAFFDVFDNTMVNGNKVNKLREAVYHPTSNHIVQCPCKMFESEGMSYRHILFVLKGKGLSEIPKFYIVNRWTKIAISKPVFDYDGNILEACSKSQSQTKLISDTWAQLFKCMHMTSSCKEKLQLK